MAFEIHRGTNISHWLSQSSARGEERRRWFTREDVQCIAGMGLDHVRLPVDEEQLWDEHGRRDPEAFELLGNVLEWCAEAGLRVVVDLHILRTHHFNDRQAPRLFTDPDEATRFAGLWRDLSDFLRAWDVSHVAYELLNEPVARDPERWHAVASVAFSAIREVEPGRTIVLGSNWFNSTEQFGVLRVPDDPHCILTFHYYKPMFITHYGASWWPGGRYGGRVRYPGRPVPEEELEGLSDEDRRLVEAANAPYDRGVMASEIALPVRVAREHGMRLYCGEFGVYHRTPREYRLAWYRDLLSVLREHDIAWANWDYKGEGFGIVTAEGQPTDIAEVLLAV